MGLVGLAGIALVTLTIGGALGLLPWLELYAGAGGAVIPEAGMYVQIAVTALFVLLMLFLPANRRIMQLERSHRDFTVSMDDIAAAYRVSHEADRAGLFRAGGEFDSVRERLIHLREHPDLGALEPEVLELAAQMSHTSRDIAEVYSDTKVERARQFLRQRQEEIETFQETLALARKTTEDLKHWKQQVETEEQVVDRQVETLKADLKALLPELGIAAEEPPRRATHSVVPMTHKSQLSAGRPVVPQKPDR
ncbi:MAG: DNA repair protein [Maritimibacter sp.]|nr:DNA repair protein [Maritimibacter sp.]